MAYVPPRLSHSELEVSQSMEHLRPLTSHYLSAECQKAACQNWSVGGRNGRSELGHVRSNEWMSCCCLGAAWIGQCTVPSLTIEAQSRGEGSAPFDQDDNS